MGGTHGLENYKKIVGSHLIPILPKLLLTPSVSLLWLLLVLYLMSDLTRASALKRPVGMAEAMEVT